MITIIKVNYFFYDLVRKKRTCVTRKKASVELVVR